MIVLLGTACSTSISSTKATKQKFLGGAAGSGWWYEYVVELERKGKHEVTIDSVWLGDTTHGKWLQFWLTNEGVGYHDKEGVFREHATKAVLKFEERFGGRARRAEEGLPKRRDVPQSVDLVSVPPKGFKAGIVIWYHFGNSSARSLTITDFTELEEMALP